MRTRVFRLEAMLLLALILLATVPASADRGEVVWTKEKPVEGEYIIRFADHVADASAAAESLGKRFNAELVHVYHNAFYGCALSGLKPNQAAALARHPDIDRVEQSSMYEARGAGAQDEAPWGLDRIDQRLLPLDKRYAYDYMGSGATVYVVDTGVLETHEDFGGRASTGINCTKEANGDKNGHGTHVAGIAGGKTYGVAKDANIVSVQVLNSSGAGSLSQILCGLDFVASQGAPGVATFALGGAPSDALTEALQVVIDRRVFVAAAPGSDESCLEGPAGLKGVLTPAASASDDSAAFVGAPGCVDLFAPGVEITSTWNTSDRATATLSGTSMAVGHVAGAAAVWLEAEPGLSPAEIEEALIARATENRILDPQGAPNLLLAKIPFVPTVVDRITPEIVRVGDAIAITGRGFDAFQSSSSRVFFTDGKFTWTAALPEMWRDDRIEVRIPTGDTIDREIIPFPSGQVFVQVQTATQLSRAVPIQMATLTGGGGTLSFQELTQISNNMDISNTLANPDNNSDPKNNKARTKDAEVGDVNGDGFADIFDNNSNNVSNSTHGILRLNNQNKTFSSTWMEPLSSSDTGTFASTTPSGGNYVGNSVSYDADFADINNDGQLDVLQTATQGTTINLVRVLMNNNPSPGQFQEDSGRIPAGALGNSIGCPDDLDTGDLNCDGWMDFGITLRRAGACTVINGNRSETRLFLNDGAGNPGNFTSAPFILNAPNSGDSTHDLFFADFNDDMAPDVVVVNEWGADSQLYLHNGSFGSPAFTQTLLFTNFDGFAGEHGDFNGDGEMDFVLAGSNKASVFINNGTPTVSFTETALPGPTSNLIYDADIGDLDCDGDLDIVVGAIVQNANAAIRVWLNDGTGTFTNATAGGATTLLPGLGAYERLSVDLIDIDNDNDLDLYVTGADGQNIGQGFGAVPNQLFENLIHP